MTLSGVAFQVRIRFVVDEICLDENNIGAGVAKTKIRVPIINTVSKLKQILSNRLPGHPPTCLLSLFEMATL